MIIAGYKRWENERVEVQGGTSHQSTLRRAKSGRSLQIQLAALGSSWQIRDRLERYEVTVRSPFRWYCNVTRQPMASHRLQRSRNDSQL